MSESVIIGTILTPLGPLGAAFSPRGLGRLAFADEGRAVCAAWARRWLPGAAIARGGPPIDDLAAQLAAYFAGQLHDFSVPLDLRGTPFQLAAWQGLLEVGYGQVRSYAAHAAAIGHPRAIRAVGAANGANPIPILVPCHRLIGSDGALVKYGGGLDVKRRLLELEGAPVQLSSHNKRQ